MPDADYAYDNGTVIDNFLHIPLSRPVRQASDRWKREADGNTATHAISYEAENLRTIMPTTIHIWNYRAQHAHHAHAFTIVYHLICAYHSAVHPDGGTDKTPRRPPIARASASVTPNIPKSYKARRR